MLIFLMIIFLLYFVSVLIARRTYNIQMERTWTYKYLNNKHKYGELLIVIVSLIILYVVGFIFLNGIAPHYFAWPVIILYSFRAAMEWTFKKATKQYIISIINAGVFLVLFIGFEVLFN